MNSDLIPEHNLPLKEASLIIRDQIPLLGKPELPAPGWFLRRRLRHAITLYERVLEMNPTNWSAMWFIGKIHQRFCELPEALIWFERSHRTNPSQPDVVREASICAMEIGSAGKAIEYAKSTCFLVTNVL